MTCTVGLALGAHIGHNLLKLVSPRVIFLTGDALAPEITPFFQRVAVPYLMKPCNATELRHAIRRAVQAAGR